MDKSCNKCIHEEVCKFYSKSDREDCVYYIANEIRFKTLYRNILKTNDKVVPTLRKKNWKKLY